MAYSISQGKFIQTAQPSPLPGTSLQGQMGGISPNLLIPMLGGGISTGEKRTLDTLQMLGLLPATETAAERQTRTKEEKSLYGGLQKIQEVSRLMQSSPERASGIIPGLKVKLGGGLDPNSLLGGLLAPSQKTNLLSGAVSEYNTRLFDIAGKAFTGPEKSLLQGLILNIGDSPEVMADKIFEAQTMISNKLGERGLPTSQKELSPAGLITLPQRKKGVPTGTGAALGGLLVGGIGSLLGPGGTIGGGVIGTAAGGALENELRNLFGKATKTGPEQVKEVAGQTLLASLLSLPAVGIQKLLTPVKLAGTVPATQQALAQEAGLLKTPVRSPLVNKPVFQREVVKPLIKDVEGQLSALLRNPGVEKSWKLHKASLEKLSNYGDLLEEKLMNINPLGRYGSQATGAQKIEANFFRQLSGLVEKYLPQETQQLLSQASQAKTAAQQISGASKITKGIIPRSIGYAIAGKILGVDKLLTGLFK